MARWFIREDKNGTKIYGDDTCHRCGGHGALEQWRFTGCTCYECGGSGRSKVRLEKEYTPEYRAKLDEMAKKRYEKKTNARKAEAEAKNAEFIQKHFAGNDTIYVIKGKTFEIKDTLKAEGCLFRFGLGWYSTNVTARDSWEVKVEDITDYNMFDETQFIHESDLNQMVKDLIRADRREMERPSEYFGEVGQRVTLNLTSKFTTHFEIPAGRGYGTEYLYIHKMEDQNGNIFVWKTTARGIMPEGTFQLVGTIKEHSEYDEIKQTVLTRCKLM